MRISSRYQRIGPTWLATPARAKSSATERRSSTVIVQRRLIFSSVSMSSGTPVSSAKFARTARRPSRSSAPASANQSATAATVSGSAPCGIASTCVTSGKPVMMNQARVRSSRKPISSGTSAAAPSVTTASASTLSSATQAFGRKPK
jgi:hypothetical protein